MKKQEKVNNQVELKDGKIATIKEAVGQDQIRAHKMCKDDTDQVLFALMELCVTIDGKEAYMSDFQNMPMKDFNKLSAAFAEINF